jgi:hybrid cluster-associated redox disulfide protein
MAGKIHVDATVEEVMRQWPQTIRAFLDFRMGCIGCPIAGFHTIADACEEHRVDLDDFLAALAAAAGPPA